MEFEEQLPGLFQDERFFNSGTEPARDAIQEHCLDKQKVRRAIQIHLSPLVPLLSMAQALLKFEKELGLELTLCGMKVKLDDNLKGDQVEFRGPSQ